VHEDAVALLERVQRDGSLHCHGVIGFWRANSRQDDIVLYRPNEDDPDAAEELCTLHGIRQQVTSGAFL
jgi:cobalamin-dependent methionine synthase I